MKAKRQRRLKSQRVKKKQKNMAKTFKDYPFTRLDSLLDISLSDDEGGLAMHSPDACGWFKVRSFSLTGIKSVCSWCCGSVASGVSAVRSLLFKDGSHNEELQNALNKVKELEDELVRVKAEKDTLSTQVTTPIPQACSCHTSCRLTSPQFITPSPLLVAPRPPAPPMAPPPPPPPPPPVVQPAKRLVIKRKGLQNRDQNASDKKPVITVGDLQRVRLKKVDHATKPTKRTNDKENQSPLVTLSAIKKVKLKRAASSEVNLKENDFSEALRRLPGEILQCKLRKTNIEKSPGGTPLIQNWNGDSGTGLTPLMTRALKKKFLFARSPSPGKSRIQESVQEA